MSRNKISLFGRNDIADVMEIRGAEEIRKEVRERYAGIARGSANGCGCGTGCCGSAGSTLEEMAVDLGYSKEEFAQTGFKNVKVEIVKGSENFIGKWFPGKGFEGSMASARIEAQKPLQNKKLKEDRKSDPDAGKQIKKNA